MNNLFFKNRLIVSNIYKSFKHQNKTISVLKNLSFEVKQSETISIVGQSGSGKSTLLHLLGGLDRIDKGSIMFNAQGKKYFFEKCSEKKLTLIRKNHIGFVFQHFYLLPDFSTLENLIIAHIINGNSESISKEKAIHYLEKVGLSHRINAHVHTLSGGEIQRTAIARAMINNPDILLADEPTGNLDHKTKDHIISLLFDWVKEQQTSLIIVTHDPSIAKLCHQEIKLENTA